MAKPILLAEDYSDDAEFLKLVLKRAGVGNPVVMLEDGDAVISYLRGDGAYADREKHPLPGILMLDLKMPGRGGFEVMEWLKTQPLLKDVLVIVLSGHHDVWEINRAYALGAKSFLFKPCNEVEISNLIKAFPNYWMVSEPLSTQR